MDKEDIAIIQDDHPCNTHHRRRREVSRQNKRDDFQEGLKFDLKSMFNKMFNGIVSMVDSAVVEGAGILGIETVNSPLMCQLSSIDRNDLKVQSLEMFDLVHHRF